jgi:dTDP-4-amino-4,6-dideoxygalactose transaminase
VNSRLDEIQAAILRVKLPHLDADNKRRREIADYYRNALAGSEVIPPEVPAGREHVYHLYVVRSASRDKMLSALRGAGIVAGIHYPVPVHVQPAFCGRGLDRCPLPYSERAAAQVLSLPIYPELARADMEAVVAALRIRALAGAVSGP